MYLSEGKQSVWVYDWKHFLDHGIGLEPKESVKILY